MSILLVVLHHASGTVGAPAWLGTLATAIDAGNLGVRIFFVISGYLITGLLIAELRTQGTISLRTFYWRRTLRIFPAAYVFLAVLALLTAARLVPLTAYDLLAGVTYTMNFYLGEWTPLRWDIAHLWSLAVEEQFYLLWPVTLLLLGTRRVVWLLVTVVVTVPLLRAASIFLSLPTVIVAVSPFLFHADWLAAGAFLAVMRPALARSSFYSGLCTRSAWPVTLVLSALMAWTAFGHWRVRELTYTWTVCATALLVDYAATVRDGRLIRCLNLAPVVWLGRVSYSLYLWQAIFLNRYASRAIASFPVNVCAALVMAAASYYAVERPVLAWRDRSGTQDDAERRA